MNKAELIDEIAKYTGRPKAQVASSLSGLLSVITSALSRGEKVTLVGFGTFERRKRQARVGVDPRDPSKRITIKATQVPVFRAGKQLKSEVTSGGTVQSSRRPPGKMSLGWEASVGPGGTVKVPLKKRRCQQHGEYVVIGRNDKCPRCKPTK